MENASAVSKGHRAEAIDRQVAAVDSVVDRVLHEAQIDGMARAESLAGMLDRLAGALGEQVRTNAWRIMEASVREALGAKTCHLANDAQERIIGRLYMRLLNEQADAAHPERIFAGLS